MFEVDLHHVRGIDAGSRIARGLESDGLQRRRSTPGLQPLLPTAAADAEVVERLLPTAMSEDRCGGIEPEQISATDLTCTRSIERAARPAAVVQASGACPRIR